MSKKPDVLLFLSDARGVYIPRDFALSVKRDCVANVDAEQWAILEAGPDHEHYWDVWSEVCDDATVTDPDTGIVYAVHQDGDCWLVPAGMEWDDARGFYWPTENPQWVCADCILYIANGDLPEDPADARRITDAIAAEPGTWVCGSAPDDEFSWSACDCCGSTLGGSRHEAAVIPANGVQS